MAKMIRIEYRGEIYTSLLEFARTFNIPTRTVYRYYSEYNNLNKLNVDNYKDGKAIHTAKYGKCKYKVGDIVNNKKILKITPYRKPNYTRNSFKIEVECLKCHRIFSYKEVHNLGKANKKCCTKCKLDLVLGGKTYYNYESITKDFGLDAYGVIQQHRIHNGDISQVGKGHNSKYCIKPLLEPGMIINDREVIRKIPNNKTTPFRGDYIIKCKHCGKIIAASSTHVLKYSCTCVGQQKKSVTMLNKTTSCHRRKQNLPRNIWYDKGRKKYILYASIRLNNKVKRLSKSFANLTEAIKYRPILKEKILEYKS